MNDLTVTFETSAGQMLGTVSLEEIRNAALAKIQANPALTYCQKQSVIKELDFLIEHERLRRVRKLAFQWVEEREAFRHGILRRKIELANSLRLATKETERGIAQLNREITNCKLDIIERVRRMRPKNESEAYLKKSGLGIAETQVPESNPACQRRNVA